MAEEFFAHLPKDSLEPAEEALRDLLLRAADAAAALLPRSGVVPLQQWVMRRMPDELTLGVDRNGLVILAPLRPQRPAEREERPGRFFERLPSDALTPKEQELRRELLGLLRQLKSPVPMKQVIRDEAVWAAKSFLPREVSLEDWIDRRIGAEVIVYQKFGVLTCRLPELFREHKEEVIATFFSGLPTDSFTPAEERLRSALLSFLADHSSQGPVNLSLAGTDGDVGAARTALLERGACKVPMSEWIERRIGAEIDLVRDEENQQFIMHALVDLQPYRSGSKGGGRYSGSNDMVDTWDAAAPERRVEQVAAVVRDSFFGELPEDALTPAEEEVRAALLDFLEQWHGDVPPSLTEVGEDERLKAARAALLPPGCHVSLRLWIDRRIGGEIETVQLEGSDNKEIYFGLRDNIDPEMLERAKERVSKRRVHGNEKRRLEGGKDWSDSWKRRR